MPPPSLWKGTDWNKMGKDSIKATLEKLGMVRENNHFNNYDKIFSAYMHKIISIHIQKFS